MKAVNTVECREPKYQRQKNGKLLTIRRHSSSVVLHSDIQNHSRDNSATLQMYENSTFSEPLKNNVSSSILDIPAFRQSLQPPRIFFLVKLGSSKNLVLVIGWNKVVNNQQSITYKAQKIL